MELAASAAAVSSAAADTQMALPAIRVALMASRLPLVDTAVAGNKMVVAADQAAAQDSKADRLAALLPDLAHRVRAKEAATEYLTGQVNPEAVAAVAARVK